VPVTLNEAEKEAIMAASKRFFGIVGSYRKGGVIDTVISDILEAAAAQGADTDKIYLADKNIEFCTNCRECVQPAGSERVPCFVHKDDDVNDIIAQAFGADTLVIGAPVNLGSANALTQRFAERCIGSYYYPWGAKFPVLRSKKKPRKAILVSSSAAPAFMNNATFGAGATATLRTIADLLGAEVADVIKVGLVSERDFEVPRRSLDKGREAARRLAA
jgi:multimeric flavodoxin WrbA